MPSVHLTDSSTVNGSVAVNSSSVVTSNFWSSQWIALVAEIVMALVFNCFVLFLYLSSKQLKDQPFLVYIAASIIGETGTACYWIFDMITTAYEGQQWATNMLCTSLASTWMTLEKLSTFTAMY